MRITYNSPNRSHHAPFARAMLRAGCLHKFVSGISRFSPRFDAREFGPHFLRADHLQNVFLWSQMKGAPKGVSIELAYWSKIWIDRCSARPASQSDVFLFYSGAGLGTMKRVKPLGVRCVVEAVNSHVLAQEALLAEFSTMDTAVAKYLNLTSYYGQQVEMDSQTRVLLPQILRAAAKLDSEVAVMGKINHLEVHNLAQFEQNLPANALTQEDRRSIAAILSRNR